MSITTQILKPISKFKPGTPCVMVTSMDDFSNYLFIPLLILGSWCLFEGEHKQIRFRQLLVALRNSTPLIKSNPVHILTEISDQIWRRDDWFSFNTFFRGCFLVQEVQEVASLLQDASLLQRGTSVLETIWYGSVLFSTLVSAFTSITFHISGCNCNCLTPQSNWIDQIKLQFKKRIYSWNLNLKWHEEC